MVNALSSRPARLFQAALVILGSALFLGLGTPSTAAASGPTQCGKPTFFGLVPWYQYLDVQLKRDNQGNTHCEIENFNLLGSKSGLLLIMLAVIDDLLRVAGIVAVAFIIVGGFKLITSQGDPQGTAAGRSTIINALIGLVIALVAITIVSFIGNKLG